MSKPVCYIIDSDTFTELKVAAEWYRQKDLRNPPALGELKAEVFELLFARATAVSDDEARRMLPQFYGHGGHALVHVPSQEVLRELRAIASDFAQPEQRDINLRSKGCRMLDLLESTEPNSESETLYRGRYCVDGHEFSNPDSDLQGDGEYPPFYIFDAQTQNSSEFAFPTREEATAWMLYAPDPLKGPSRVRPKSGKSFIRTRHWVRVCEFIDRSIGQGLDTRSKREMVEYVAEQRELARVEGFDDTVTYLQHVLDDLGAA